MSTRTALTILTPALVAGAWLVGCGGSSGGGAGAVAPGATAAATTSAASSAPVSSPAAAPATLPRLTIQGTRFLDPHGRTVFLRGANYSHRTKTAPHWQWQRESHLAEMRAWGFNCVRYLLLWKLVEPQPGQIDQAYLDHVVQVLDWCERQGLYVLVDMHQDLYCELFGGDGAPTWAAVDHLVTPNELVHPWFLTYFTREVQASFDRLWTDAALQDHFAGAWKAVAERVRGRSCVIGYNLINEPSSGTELPWDCERGSLRRFYERVIAEVQTVDPEAVFFLEPLAATSDFGIPSQLTPPPGVRAVWAPHFYDPFLAAGAPWSGEWVAELGYGVHATQAASFGLPLFVGEFGAPRQHPDVRQALDAECRAMERRLVPGWTVWNHNPDPATNSVLEEDILVLDDPRHGEHPALDALVRPYAAAVAGEPVEVAFDLSTRTLRVAVDRVDPTLPTVIRLPVRHYPAAPQVQGPGRWVYEAGLGELHWWGDPAAGRNVLTVTP